MIITLLLAETTEDGWRPGIGDPTFMGWLTVAAYFIAAWLCWRAYGGTPRLNVPTPRVTGLHRPPRRQRSARVSLAPSHEPEAAHLHRLWLWLAILFIALGVNKQLDLQSLFTQIGRGIVRAGGWYEHRRTLQAIFIMLLAAGGLTGIGWLTWKLRASPVTYKLALTGTVFLVAFIIARAASFHHIDEMLGWDVLGFNMNWAMELGGIGCVAAAALLEGRRADRARRQRNTAGSEADLREGFRWMVQRLRSDGR